MCAIATPTFKKRTGTPVKSAISHGVTCARLQSRKKDGFVVASITHSPTAAAKETG